MIKIPATDRMLRDLERLRELMGTRDEVETISRAIVTELLVREMLKTVSALEIEGEKKDGPRRKAII